MLIGLPDQLRLCYDPWFIELLSGSTLSVPVSCRLSLITLLIGTNPAESNDKQEINDSNACRYLSNLNKNHEHFLPCEIDIFVQK